ncbi:hypothetical protein LX12_004330, partial [Williamsia serinedens]|nr:hypothetical protein [Williamsia serinedens]
MGDIDNGIENLRALIDQAHHELGEVCAKGPHNRFRMSVPARPDH